MSWLVLCQLDTIERHLGEGESHLRNSCQITCKQGCSTFSWLVIGVGGHSSLGQCWIIWESWPSVKWGAGQWYIPQWLLLHVVLLSSCLGSCPVLPSWWIVIQTCKLKQTLCSPSCFWWRCLIISRETLIITNIMAWTYKEQFPPPNS